MKIEDKLDAALAKVKAEALRAFAKHGPMNSPHEAFGVIYEEFMIEFAAELRSNSAQAQMNEMVQVAAMAVRALVDLYSERPRNAGQ